MAVLLACVATFTFCLALIQPGPCSTATIAGELNAALNSILPAEIRGHIDVLADDSFEGRESGSRGGRAAGEYLMEQLESYDLRPAGDSGTYLQTFQNGKYRNVLGLLEGSDPVLKSEIILLGAHYDHVGYGNRKNSRGPFGYVHNGADDNASGVSGLLEVAQAFQAFGQPPSRSILFALWDGEEQGLVGSKHWANDPTVPIKDVALVINLDMIGRMRNERLHVYGTRTGPGLRRLVSMSNQMTDLVLDFTWEMKAKSDHHSFFAKNIPVLMLHTGLHDDYHRPSDDADKINHEGASETARLLFSLLTDLADQPDRMAFRTESRFEGPADQENFQRPAPPRTPRLGASWRKIAGDTPGIYLTVVRPGTPAAAAELREGDRVLRFAGREVRDEFELRRDVLSANSPVEIAVQRGEHEMLEVLLDLAGNPLRLGVSWRENEAEMGTVMLSEVVPGSVADEAGLKVGDRVYRFANRDFAGSDELLGLVSATSGPVELLIEREGRIRTVLLDLPPPTRL
jgi:hypothetical protein